MGKVRLGLIAFILLVSLLTTSLPAPIVVADDPPINPTISSVSPDKVAPGQVLNVTLGGGDFCTESYSDQVIDVDFGEGIRVEINAVAPAWIEARVTVDSGAALGPRSITATTVYSGQFTFPDMFTVTDSAPVIAAISPDHMNQGETGNVVLSGVHFTGVDTASFGAGTTANLLTIDSDSQITVNLTVDSSAALGGRDVWVSSSQGTGTWLYGFTVATTKPVVGTVIPWQGALGATLTGVAINGMNFTGTTSVGFGSGITPSNIIASPTQITIDLAIASTADPGYRDVSVVTPEGTGTSPNAFCVLPVPTIDSVDPSTHAPGGDQFDLTIYGSGFVGEIPEVSFGNDSGITVDPDQIQFGDARIDVLATVEAGAAIGYRDVTVTMPGGTATLAGGFRVSAAPWVSGVVPSVLIPGQTADVTINGANFVDVSEVTFGIYSTEVTVDHYHVLSPAQIVANVTVAADAAPGGISGSVSTPDGWAAFFLSVLEAPPTISAISPTHGSPTDYFEVTINGANLLGSSVSFGPDSGITIVDEILEDSPSQIRASISISADAALGTRDVTVTTPSGTDTLEDGFAVVEFVPAPTISSVDPGQGMQGQSLTVTINGSNLTNISSASFGDGISITNMTEVSETQMTVDLTIDAAAGAGDRDVVVTTPGGTATRTRGFEVISSAPKIYGVNPRYGLPGQTLSVDISGINLDGISALSFGDGIYVDSYSGVSETQVIATISIDVDAVLGTRDVTVTTSRGTDTAQNYFEVVTSTLTVTGVSPASHSPDGESFDVTINGSGFLDMPTAIDFGDGITVDMEHMSIYPTCLHLPVTVATDAAIGYRDVTVTMPGGTATLAGGFRVSAAPPWVSDVSPNELLPGQTADVTISGANFFDVSEVTIYSTEVTVNHYHVLSPAQIVANVTVAADAAPGGISGSVKTPDGWATFGFVVWDPSVNHPPVAHDDLVATDENTPVTADVAANDTDRDGDLDPTTVEFEPPALGSLVNHQDGWFTYTPPEGYSGVQSFTYQIWDTAGEEAYAWVTIVIGDFPHPPEASDDFMYADENTRATIDVTNNDTDIARDLIRGSAELLSAPQHGALINNHNGAFTFTPNAGFKGMDSFTYRIYDTKGASDTAVVTIQVGLNDPPIANDDWFQTDEDTPVTINVADNDFDWDGNLDPTTVVVVSDPVYGTVDLPPVVVPPTELE